MTETTPKPLKKPVEVKIQWKQDESSAPQTLCVMQDIDNPKDSAQFIQQLITQKFGISPLSTIVLKKKDTYYALNQSLEKDDNDKDNTYEIEVLSSGMHSLLAPEKCGDCIVNGTILGNIYMRDNFNYFDMNMLFTFSVPDHYAQEEIVLTFDLPKGCVVSDNSPKTAFHPRSIQESKEFDIGGNLGSTPALPYVSLGISSSYKQSVQETLTFQEWNTAYRQTQNGGCEWTLSLASVEEFHEYPQTAVSSMTTNFTLSLDITEVLKTTTSNFEIPLHIKVTTRHSGRSKESPKRVNILRHGWEKDTSEKEITKTLQWPIGSRSAKPVNETAEKPKVPSVYFTRAYARIR